MKKFSLILITVLLFDLGSFKIIRAQRIQNDVSLAQAPIGSLLTDAFKVWVNNSCLPIYAVRVAAADDGRRFKAVDDLLHSEDYYDEAGLGYFALNGSANVKIKMKFPLTSVRILPASANIKTSISGEEIYFKVHKRENLTIEFNGDIVHSLHLFVNPADTYRPNLKDPNLIYSSAIIKRCI
jgi:hypothetical protein